METCWLPGSTCAKLLETHREDHHGSGEFSCTVFAWLPPPCASAAYPFPLPGRTSSDPPPRRAHGLVCLDAAQHHHRGARRRGPRRRRGCAGTSRGGLQVSAFSDSTRWLGEHRESPLTSPVLLAATRKRRNAVDSALFKQWLSNLQSEKGVLTYGRLNLTRILIQGVDMFGKRVGFLKFKADIIDEETKTKVIDWIVAITVVLLCICLDLRNPSWSCILDWMSLRTNNNGLGNRLDVT